MPSWANILFSKKRMQNKKSLIHLSIHSTNTYWRPVIDWIVYSPISHVEALPPNMAVFEGEVFRGIIQVKWGHMNGAFIQ